MSRVCILLLNWNGWRDTVECLESVFRIDYPDYRVVVCDNGSTDDSIERIRSWAEGESTVEVSAENPLRRLSWPPVPKPVSYVEFDRKMAEAGGDRAGDSARLILVRTGGNLGFAGGNNVGLRYALARDDFEYVWLLNNDTVVEPDALACLVRRMREKPRAGICGSTLPFYSLPGKLWARGGATYNRWFAYAECIGIHQAVDSPAEPEEVERKMDYVAGASMFVSRPFLRDVGLMGEQYFLYFEEPDWAVRAKGRYELAYARDSVVYHKVGSSLHSLQAPPGEGRTSTRHNAESAMRFTRKYYPLAVPTVWLTLLAVRAAAACKDLCRRNPVPGDIRS
jgi:GT2 family glycosyltransferase